MTAVRPAQRFVGGSWLTHWTPELVQTAEDPPLAFASYVQQTAGCPWPTLKDQSILRRKCKDFFKQYPDATWFTLCRVVDWVKGQRKRHARVWMYVDRFRDCWAAGQLPELDYGAVDTDLEVAIEKALQTETREGWRARLIGTTGPESRKKVYEEWLSS